MFKDNALIADIDSSMLRWSQNEREIHYKLHYAIYLHLRECDETESAADSIDYCFALSRLWGWTEEQVAPIHNSVPRFYRTMLNFFFEEQPPTGTWQ